MRDLSLRVLRAVHSDLPLYSSMTLHDSKESFCNLWRMPISQNDFPASQKNFWHLHRCRCRFHAEKVHYNLDSCNCNLIFLIYTHNARKNVTAAVFSVPARCPLSMFSFRYHFVDGAYSLRSFGVWHVQVRISAFPSSRR